LGNLADNALKYTDSGWIAFSCEIKPEEVIISAIDTGRGMDPDRLVAVRSGEAEPDPDIPGSRGIGLSGVRRMVELAGGSFELRSQSGRGTKVTLRFPR
jgi:signal transduction histidine kinase